jgi:ATP-dependent Zn protease
MANYKKNMPAPQWPRILLFALLSFLILSIFFPYAPVDRLEISYSRFKKLVQTEREDFDEGRDKILMGIEREEAMKDEEKETIAYHEAGHTLMARLLPGADPLEKVSIIPRGRALGATEQVPEEDRRNLSRSYLLNRIAIMLGGRVAEKLAKNDLSSGAGDDLKKPPNLPVAWYLSGG